MQGESVPAEEAREDVGAKDISFHVYEYKVSLRKDGMEQRQLKSVANDDRRVPLVFLRPSSRTWPLPHDELQACGTMLR